VLSSGEHSVFAHNGLDGGSSPSGPTTQFCAKRDFLVSAELRRFPAWCECMVWLEVRVLPAPPRSLSFAEISSRLANSRELAGSAARVRVSAETNYSEQAFSTELSLGSEFRFPALKIPISWRRRQREASIRRSFSVSRRCRRSQRMGTSSGTEEIAETGNSNPASERRRFALLSYMSVQKLRTPKGLAHFTDVTKLRNKNVVLLALQRLQDRKSGPIEARPIKSPPVG
jgi:hypothetical protein